MLTARLAAGWARACKQGRVARPGASVARAGTGGDGVSGASGPGHWQSVAP